MKGCTVAKPNVTLALQLWGCVREGEAGAIRIFCDTKILYDAIIIMIM